jgi:catechol 2,3-dioxygenase-like lactoylglutathione lyase family enzyme
MQVRNIRWVGTATSDYAPMAAFARDVLGMRVSFEEEATTELLTLDGDAFQVFGPGDDYHDFFGRHARGPVPLFEVDDVHERFGRARPGRHRGSATSLTTAPGSRSTSAHPTVTSTHLPAAHRPRRSDRRQRWLSGC